MGTLRVFAAVAPPEEVRHALVDQLGEFRIPGRLVPPQNWHMTLRFLGDIDDTTLDRFVAGLDQSELGKSFMLSLARFGAFPNHRKATVVWVGPDRGALPLHQLAEVSDEAALASGVTPEDRPFAPHLTISRVRPPADAREIIHNGEIDISWRVSEVVVFQSCFERGGVRYEPLEIFPLNR